MQRLAIPEVIKGKNTLIVAPTGAGKTESAIIPIFNKILEIKEATNLKGILALYITSLRALNRDRLDRLYWWYENLNISIVVRHGDNPHSERIKQSKKTTKFSNNYSRNFPDFIYGKKVKEIFKDCKNCMNCWMIREICNYL